MPDEPAYKLDIRGLSPSGDEESQDVCGGNRPWVGVRFDCCGVYVRIYRNPDQKNYEGRCPKCRRKIRLKVGPDGTSTRFFSAE